MAGNGGGPCPFGGRRDSQGTTPLQRVGQLIRNRDWLAPKLADAVRERGIALALIDQSWMPRPAVWFERFPSDDGPITADFTYIRWKRDPSAWRPRDDARYCARQILDRREPLQDWVKVCDQAVRCGVEVCAFANNHYAGHGPATVRLFKELWREWGVDG
jgi:uncharacterized protein YecE (DUF72 family)